jgi:adenylate cyclase
MLANRWSIGEDPGMDFEGTGLLDGLDGEEREARRKFLERLAQDGFSLEQLASAVAENRLALLPLDRVFGGAHSATEIKRRTGLPADTMIDMRRLLGLPDAGPDDEVFSDEDIEAAHATTLFIEAGFDQEEIFEIARVLGEGMARLSATVTAAFIDTYLSPGDREEDVAERFAELAQQLTPALTPVLVAAFKDHLGDSVSRGVLGRAELEAGDAAASQALAVCFADLVGFTRLGVEVEPTELGSVAGRLARLATSVSRDPVRLIKTIGDAAMFVSTDAGAMVAVALELVQAVEDAGLPSLRAGIATGPALQRAGDYYGNSVNLASRVTGIARPGSVLCTQEVRDTAGDDGLHWSSAGRHRLKGVAGPVPLFRARLPEPGLDGQSSSPKPRAGRSRRRAQS